MTKIVILDGYTSNPGDLHWEAIEALGELTAYSRTADEELIERAMAADILVVNKRELAKKALDQLPNLKCICTLATGYNNIDIEHARSKNIPVCNAVGYSSSSVAQHVFSLLLELTNHVGRHSTEVDAGAWAKAIDWCFWTYPLIELSGKKMGIYGYGKIGREVGKIARAFGMEILVLSRGDEKDVYDHVTCVPSEALFRESDVLTLHTPLTSDNQHYINKDTLKLMKRSAFLINTGRGGLVNETDLKEALLNKQIAGAGLDVLSKEPPGEGHPLINVPNCIITPHIAWASKESRMRLIQQVADNIAAFIEGRPQNVVN